MLKIKFEVEITYLLLGQRLKLDVNIGFIFNLIYLFIYQWLLPGSRGGVPAEAALQSMWFPTHSFIVHRSHELARDPVYGLGRWPTRI